MKGKCSVDLTVTIGNQCLVVKVFKIHSEVAYIIPLTFLLTAESSKKKFSKTSKSSQERKGQ